MTKAELKVGMTVRANFRKYGVHSVIGEITEISTNEHALEGTWVSIKVNDGNKSDMCVQLLIKNKIQVMLPIRDVVETLN